MPLVSVNLHLADEPLDIAVDHIQSLNSDFYSLRLGDLMNGVSVFPFPTLDDVEILAHRIIDEAQRLRLAEPRAQLEAK